MTVLSVAPRLSRLRHLSWPHPEWWSLCLCGAAWLAILWPTGETHGSHATHHGHSTNATWPGGGAAWTTEVFWWLVMIVAMMFPLVRDSIRTTAARSLWRRRHRAIAGFLAGYLGPWMAFGVVASVAVASLRTPERFQPAAALGFGAALLWQVTTPKRRALLACHRTRPIAPTGWRADRDCLRFGWTIGSSCLVSCWALMLACMLAGHSLPAMAGVTAACWAERNMARLYMRLVCALIAMLGLAYAVAPYL